MRELPEFQVLANYLNNFFKGKVLSNIEVINTRKIKENPEDLDKNLIGNVLQSIYRHGKELHFQFMNNMVLGVNLMMHGKVHLFEKNNEEKFTIAELRFDNGEGLALTDWQENTLIKLNPEEKNGIDALSKDLHPFLLSALQTKAKIKSVITNQKVIRGIGSVYADEILWEAKVSPFSISSAIPEFKIKALANAVKKVLTTAEKEIISKRIVLFSAEPYDFLKIHGKVGDKSPTGCTIKVDKKAGHSTYYTEEQVLYK